MSENKYRLLPSIDLCLNYLTSKLSLSPLILKDLANEFLNIQRKQIDKLSEAELEHSKLFLQMESYIDAKLTSTLRPVINATGVVIHTNLGRSRLAKSAAQKVYEISLNYNTLEYDLQNEARGSRTSHIEPLLCKITGAEAGLVVNNNAAAVLLMLDSLCKDKEVIVSRGQLVEIGGSFRIPDIMSRSGTILKEVGTTNRTHAEDYQQALNPETSAILHVHSSNFKIIGFTSEVSFNQLASLAHGQGIPLLVDLGSGSLLDLSSYGIKSEPTVQEILANGADIVTFSGDKVLGSAQAGIIVGKKEYIDKLKKNQLLRALRVDKMCLAALEESLKYYLDPKEAIKNIPTLADICLEPELLAKKAHKLKAIMQKKFKKQSITELKLNIILGISRIGGGSYPEYDLTSSILSLNYKNIQALKTALIQNKIPVITRIEKNALLFDPRTMNYEDFNLVADLVCQAYNTINKE